jgi:hypothetical protein
MMDKTPITKLVIKGVEVDVDWKAS